MTDEVRLKIREYARSISVSDTSVRKAIKAGKLAKSYDPVTKTILKSLADGEYGTMAQAATVKPGMSTAQVIAKIEKKAIKNEEKTEKTKDSDGAKLPPIIVKKGPGHLNVSQPVRDFEDDESEDLEETDGIDKILKRDAFYKAELNRMKMEEQLGSLVRQVDVDRLYFGIANQLKKALGNIPARCIDQIMSSTNRVEAENILVKEINEALEIISQLKEVEVDAATE